MTTDNVRSQPGATQRVERFLAEVGDLQKDDSNRDVRMARAGLPWRSSVRCSRS